MNELAQAVSTKLTISADGKTIELPTWTSNVFPNMPTIEPVELAKWITIKYNPPSILLIDIRPRDIFIRGCVKHQWIIQIEPAILQKEYVTCRVMR
jgi:ubiquitin carboxyl-terminal hydrolase 8